MHAHLPPLRPAAVNAILVSALALALAGCAVRGPAIDAQAPASPSATPGRLAGAPPALRAGVVTYPDVPAVRSAPAEHHHHHTK